MMQGDLIDSATWHRHAGINRAQSLALLVFMATFLALLGWLLWGAVGVVVLLAVGVVGVWINPGVSPQWVMRLYGASRLGRGQTAQLQTAVAVLAQRAGLPAVPEIYYVPSRMINAFAVGAPRRAAIAVTDGLLRQLGWRELVAVLAHEISHIRSNDLWVMGLADMFSRATSLLSLFGLLLLLVNLPLVLFSTVTINWFAILLLVFAPLLASLAQLALARTREYDADLNAVALTGDPDGLARALVRIEQIQGGWLERLFLPGRHIPEPSVLRTHPATRDRVVRLAALKGAYPGRRLYEQLDVPGLVAHPRPRPPRRRISGLWF